MALFNVPKNPSSAFANMKGDHTGVRVPDLDAAIAWYTEKLDFRLTAITHMSDVFRKLQHDINGLSFIEDGNRIAVEGREWSELADGTPFPDGKISHGLFCNVYEFEGDLIRAVRIYTDPDFTSSDAAALQTLRPAT